MQRLFEVTRMAIGTLLRQRVLALGFIALLGLTAAAPLVWGQTTAPTTPQICQSTARSSGRLALPLAQAHGCSALDVVQFPQALLDPVDGKLAEIEFDIGAVAGIPKPGTGEPTRKHDFRVLRPGFTRAR